MAAALTRAALLISLGTWSVCLLACSGSGEVPKKEGTAPTSVPTPYPVPTPPAPTGPEPKPAAAAPYKDPPAQYTEAGQLFLRKHYQELEGFKSNPKFHEFGFAVAGPYHRWFKSVDEIRTTPEFKQFSSDERIAIGYLLNLGNDYRTNKGADTKFAKFARDDIERALRK